MILSFSLPVVIFELTVRCTQHFEQDLVTCSCNFMICPDVKPIFCAAENKRRMGGTPEAGK